MNTSPLHIFSVAHYVEEKNTSTNREKLKIKEIEAEYATLSITQL